jgi:putative intracellular protease/amidase
LRFTAVFGVSEYFRDEQYDEDEQQTEETSMQPSLAVSIAISLLWTGVSFGAEPRRVLIGVSNVAEMGDSEHHEAKNNLWEVAPAYHVFVLHGFEVDFVSPKGGAVPFGREVDEFDPPGMVSYTIKYERFREKSSATLKPENVDSSHYAGYFVAGGAGPLFDLATDERVLGIAARIYEAGGAVGGCGHGPGSLANIKLETDDYIVRGKKVTGFPNSSEKISRWSKNGVLLPFLVEDLLRKRGGVFQTKDDLADKFDVLVDGRIITTMFLSSCANAAKEMINVIGR